MNTTKRALCGLAKCQSRSGQGARRRHCDRLKERRLRENPVGLRRRLEQDAETLEKSLRVLKPGGTLSSISGPPDPEFAKEQGLNVVVRLVLRLLSRAIRTKAKRQGVRFSFLFMRADGEQLSKITSLIESGAISPVMDRVFPFEATREALAYVETGRAKGKAVVKRR
jgi:NADPH:quinone reductase-like Zn-dependent oxidoreductase